MVVKSNKSKGGAKSIQLQDTTFDAYQVSHIGGDVLQKDREG